VAKEPVNKSKTVAFQHTYLEVDLEVGNEEQEHVEGQLEDPWQGRNAVDADRRAQISLERLVDEAMGVLERGAGRLEDGKNELQGEDLALHIHRIGKQSDHNPKIDSE
jgi:hypothetical protein